MAKGIKIDEAVRKTVASTAVSDGRGETDTVRLWESFRDQAQMWRAIALLQIPTTLILIAFSAVIWATRSVTLNVPAKPLPGQYLAQEIPDTEFVEEATNYVNLITSYQPATVRRQFMAAREMLFADVIKQFDIDMMDMELKAIEATGRSQVFYIDPSKTQINRPSERIAEVLLIGERVKFIGGSQQPSQMTAFKLTLGTVPRHKLNPYGIVVLNVEFRNADKSNIPLAK